MIDSIASGSAKETERLLNRLDYVASEVGLEPTSRSVSKEWVERFLVLTGFTPSDAQQCLERFNRRLSCEERLRWREVVAKNEGESPITATSVMLLAGAALSVDEFRLSSRLWQTELWFDVEPLAVSLGRNGYLRAY